MYKRTAGCVSIGLMLALASPSQAVINEGTWDTTGSDLQTGTWLEVFGPGGPGQPGAELSAQSMDDMQWSLGNIFIFTPAVGMDNGDGTITYTTDYGNVDDPGMSMLMLGEAMTLWGDAANFTSLMLTVDATVDMSTGVYLGGTFTGTAYGHDGAAGYVLEMNGTLAETNVIADPPSHEGTIDYMEVTIYRPTVEFPLDIKPGSCPNALNRKSRGVTTVALLGTETNDVSMIDLSTIQLARADGVGGFVMPLEGPKGPHTTMEDVATPFVGEPCECHEEYGDGFVDLVMKFNTPALVEALELLALMPGDDVAIVVTGTMMDGTPFTAGDCFWLNQAKIRVDSVRARTKG